jgi:hypothetical protein
LSDQEGQRVYELGLRRQDVFRNCAERSRIKKNKKEDLIKLSSDRINRRWSGLGLLLLHARVAEMIASCSGGSWGAVVAHW